MPISPSQPRFAVIIAPLIVAAVLVIPACSSPTTDSPRVEPVSGSVFVNGNPAVGAVVTFHPAAPQGQNKLRPRGVVQADGTFRLTTYTTGDGAATGDYAVTLYWPEKDDPDLEARGIEVKDRFQNRFKDPSRPFKRVTVREGENALERFTVQ
ncbi:hypothetical protein VT84_25645 [Gemmata sp. SH-PL17]|uniref:hypothetical protein n=1 Tax=Gemmata sp. SH-PL17 TaxID=1630693 RepID=UPI0006969498|nr:hypothetical protein [Gemmata sp. SH-PL17]AMV27812.1 hypothetical protein VT84_25645 [Gemmata sp. SH-PL17]